jgi:hypothetical protein
MLENNNSNTNTDNVGVYPRLHDLLEKNFKKHVDREEEWSTCDHEWEPIIIHKIGVGYKCYICFRKIAEEKFKRIFLN